ncbi:MAG TPA: hypothetical protein IGS53_00430 [Leptolyngbyaceae cyanobacterium M33_DOE_097]|uniref:Hydrogenase maturation nickel metallochaperone HypA n=1 Tax=Oscillatoriales cyanobacterium SpSt-418 TaxID=2282169 RepID=A0A7C3PHJ8_9CYAN|nr:hypothetical protein [Leptolyngbyaceae cyanobacterium M33_DOE_097]
MSLPAPFHKLPECNHCQFFSGNALLPCSVHPTGVSEASCLDYREDERAAQHWQTFLGLDWVAEPGHQEEEVRYYCGEVIRDRSFRLSDLARLELLDYHPMFTGRCPECEMPMQQTEPPRVHWDCSVCGWKDDEI